IRALFLEDRPNNFTPCGTEPRSAVISIFLINERKALTIKGGGKFPMGDTSWEPTTRWTRVRFVDMVRYEQLTMQFEVANRLLFSLALGKQIWIPSWITGTIRRNSNGFWRNTGW